MLKKIAKKKGKTLPLRDQETKKSSSRVSPKKKGSFFPLVPQRKKIAQGVVDRGNFFYFFWQFFSTCEKITQVLEFCK